MGKKVKVGKARKDRFYQLAKESGYRARSAFKLLQLNRKYEFLQKSRACIDLCAAPGGWLQVAAEHMPISSLIVGVDLVPIRPIRNVITLQEDITTEKCRQALKKELHTWDADVVLNDGAPNVGKNWIHDAFQQAELTLAALKLATEFLRKGGWFVTKVFRSKDYTALMWVFGQLFKKVYATKPQASRNESAEIFVVCQNFIKPDKLDPKFLDPKYVFKDVKEDSKSALNVIYPTKVNKRAEGYEDDDISQHYKLDVMDFIKADNFLDLLGKAHEVSLTDEVANHALTTREIKECCADIKVLGKKDIRAILTWRKKLKTILKTEEKAANEEEDMNESEEGSDDDGEKEEGEDSDDEELKVQKQIADLQEEEQKDLKKKRKKVMKEKRKLRDKMNLNMIIKGDTMEIGEDLELFNLKKIKSKHQLKEVEKDEMEDEEEPEEEVDMKQSHRVMYDRYDDEKMSGDSESDDDDEEEEEKEEDEDDISDAEEQDMEMEEMENASEKNPLLVDLESKDVRAQQKMEQWFRKDVFSGLEAEADEDLEIAKMSEEYKKKGGVILDQSKEKAKLKKQKRKLEEVDDADYDSGHVSDEDDASDDDDSDDDDEDESDSDSDDDSDASDYDVHAEMRKVAEKRRQGEQVNKTAGKDGFEIVPQNQRPAKKIVKLDAVGLAIGEEMIKSKKRRREIIEMSYNRNTFNDDTLPDWFIKDEHKYNKKILPVSKEQIDHYKELQKSIDARPIKKIAEARARKKRKAVKKLERVRKKAEAIGETHDVSEKEKWQQIKNVYKKAGLLSAKKKEITYVVAKKGVGKRVKRPAGVKGQFKVVDPRLKKDLRNGKIRDKRSGKKGGKKGGKGGRPGGKGRGK